ncbi:hypothetical protein [Streptomyces sp. YKOK-J1]
MPERTAVAGAVAEAGAAGGEPVGVGGRSGITGRYGPERIAVRSPGAPRRPSSTTPSSSSTAPEP